MRVAIGWIRELTLLWAAPNNVGNQRLSRESVSRNITSWLFTRSSNCFIVFNVSCIIDSPIVCPGIGICRLCPLDCYLSECDGWGGISFYLGFSKTKSAAPKSVVIRTIESMERPWWQSFKNASLTVAHFWCDYNSRSIDSSSMTPLMTTTLWSWPLHL